MWGVLVAELAKLLCFHAVWVVLFLFHGVVVALFAFRAGKCDSCAHFSALAFVFWRFFW